MPPKEPAQCLLHQDLLQETHDNTVRLLTMMVDAQKRLDNHHATLYGNGKPGLRDEVQDLKGFRSTVSTVFWWLATPLAAVLVGALGTGAWVVIKLVATAKP